MLKKGLKFVLSKKDGTIVFNLSLVLLPIKVDPISEKQGCKRDALVARGISCVEIIFVLLTKVINTLYINFYNTSQDSGP